MVISIALIAGIACLVVYPRSEVVTEVVEKTKTKVREVRSRGTVQDRVDRHGPEARARFTPYFEAAGVSYPPQSLTFVGIKDSKTLELYAAHQEGDVTFIRSYPILAASGDLGPKTKQGDRQVPEGIYRIEYFNPNSSYHLSMKIDYPNAFDQRMATEDGRDNLGGDIMIHGRSASIGCLAMGDEAVEELFVMAAETGRTNIQVILSPTDFRTGVQSEDLPIPEWSPSWTRKLHESIQNELTRIPSPPK